MRHDRRAVLLLVEDSPDEEVMVMRALRHASLPCHLLVAHTTEEALDFLLARGAFAGRDLPNPDVIVTDLKVDLAGGAELTSAIRSQPSTKTIPIVVFSGSSDEAQIEDLYKRGANSFVEKPVDVEEFARTVANLARYWGLLNATVSPSGAPASFPYSL